MRNRRNRGGSAVELALILPFITTLIIGTMVYGTQLIKELQITQVARDAASMYSRGTDFTKSSNQAIVARLGQELGWPSTGLTSTSTGVVTCPRLCTSITPAMALLRRSARAATKTVGCLLNAIAFGNSGMRSSNYGSPPASCGACYVTGSNGDLNLNRSMYNSNAKVSSFTLLGTPAAGASGFQPGQPAHLVEVAAPTVPGMAEASVTPSPCFDRHLTGGIMGIEISPKKNSQKGQALIMFTLMVSSVLVPMVGLAIDGAPGLHHTIEAIHCRGRRLHSGGTAARQWRQHHRTVAECPDHRYTVCASELSLWFLRRESDVRTAECLCRSGRRVRPLPHRKHRDELV